MHIHLLNDRYNSKNYIIDHFYLRYHLYEKISIDLHDQIFINLPKVLMMSSKPKKNNTVIFLAVLFLLCDMLSVESLPQSNGRDLFRFPGHTQNNDLNTQRIYFGSPEDQNLSSGADFHLSER